MSGGRVPGTIGQKPRELKTWEWPGVLVSEALIEELRLTLLAESPFRSVHQISFALVES